MDSDKAAVWVTNWDTERNGSSLTTRDGTSYLLANAFMLAYDYGQPHIFSGYYYAASTTRSRRHPHLRAGHDLSDRRHRNRRHLALRATLAPGTARNAGPPSAA